MNISKYLNYYIKKLIQMFYDKLQMNVLIIIKNGIIRKI